jgi:hypothetical protein
MPPPNRSRAAPTDDERTGPGVRLSCWVVICIKLKGKRASAEEGTNSLGLATQSAHGRSDALGRNGQVGWAQAAERMLFQPCPEPFVGVEFRSVGGEAIYPKTVALNSQGGAGPTGAMRVAAVPEQKDGLVGGETEGVQLRSCEFIFRQGKMDSAQY